MSAQQPPTQSASQSDVHCTCLAVGHNISCPWVRGVADDGEFIGHVKACPVSGDPCPCLPGSIAEAHCAIEARRG